jgi:manganese transport protein
MSGFMNWHIPLLVRRALTMAPSLLVLALAVNTTQALIYSQLLLSFGIPFAVIPLLLVSRDRAVMTDMTNRRLTSGLMMAATAAIIGLNLYLLSHTVAGAL